MASSRKPDYFWTDEASVVRPGHLATGVRLSANDKKVLEFLRRGPATKREIMEATGLTSEQVKWHTRKLRQKGIIRYDEKSGRWELVRRRGSVPKLSRVDLSCSENVRRKAERLLSEGKVKPVAVSADGTVVAEVEGDHGTYLVAYNEARGEAGCQCEWAKHHPERVCSHKLALIRALQREDFRRKVSLLKVTPQEEFRRIKRRIKKKGGKSKILAEYVPHLSFSADGSVTEVEWVRMLIETGSHVLLEGPSGCGKSMLLSGLLQESGRDYILVTGEEAASDDFVETTKLDGGNSSIVPGPLIRAMEEGKILVINEVNMINPKNVGHLMTAMTEGWFVAPLSGRVVRAKPGFQVIATMNFGYTGTRELNDALRARFVSVRFDYLPIDMEVDRIVRMGVPRDVAETVGKIGEELRKRAREEALPAVATSRGFTFFAKIYKKCEEQFGKVDNKMLRHIIAATLVRSGTLDPEVEKSLMEGCVDLFLPG